MSFELFLHIPQAFWVLHFQDLHLNSSFLIFCYLSTGYKSVLSLISLQFFLSCNHILIYRDLVEFLSSKRDKTYVIPILCNERCQNSTNIPLCKTSNSWAMTLKDKISCNKLSFVWIWMCLNKAEDFGIMGSSEYNLKLLDVTCFLLDLFEDAKFGRFWEVVDQE